MKPLVLIVITLAPHYSANISSHKKKNQTVWNSHVFSYAKFNPKNLDENFRWVYIMKARNHSSNLWNKFSIIVTIVLFLSDQSSVTLSLCQFSLTCGKTFQIYNPILHLFSSWLVAGYLQYQLMKILKKMRPLNLFIIRLNFMFMFLHQSKSHSL